MSTWCWVISFFNDFCCFWSVAVNIVDKLQLLIFLTSMCNVSLCNYKIYFSSFLILKSAAVRHTHAHFAAFSLLYSFPIFLVFVFNRFPFSRFRFALDFTYYFQFLLAKLVFFSFWQFSFPLTEITLPTARPRTRGLQVPGGLRTTTKY